MSQPNSIARQLTFMAGCLPRTPFRELAESAGRAGFDSISLWPNVWRHALNKEGLKLADMRAMLEHNGLALTDVDAYRGWAPPDPDPAQAVQRHPAALEEFLEVGAALGGSTVVAVHSTAPLHFEREVESFARLCDRAAEHGLRVAMEAMAFTSVPDFGTAWKIVAAAGRPNGGVTADVGHYMRSTRDAAALRAIPADRVFTVQLCDGPDQAPADLLDEARYHRGLPGTGDFRVRGFVQILADMGVRTSVGPEVYHDSFQSRPPLDVMRELIAAVRKMLPA